MPARPIFSFAEGRPSLGSPIAHTIHGSPISRRTCAASGGRCGDSLNRRPAGDARAEPATPTAKCAGSSRLPEPIVERVAGATHGSNRIRFVAAVERLAQSADMHVHRALVDIDLAAPYPVEQLFAREDAAGPLHQEFEQTVFGRAEIDGAAGARDAFLLPVHLKLAEGPQ